MKVHCDGCAKDETQSIDACHIIHWRCYEWIGKVLHQLHERNRICE